MEIEYLSWDTDTFGFKVGNLVSSSFPNSDDLQSVISKAKKAGYKLLYLKDQDGIDEYLSDSFFLSDEKVIYTKTLGTSFADGSKEIVSYLHQPLQADLLLLALQSGGHSRYYMDKKMPIHAYLSLYDAWIKNSLDGSIASDVLVYQENGTNIGLLTYKKSTNCVIIGLVAVNYAFRDRGIGSKLIKHLDGLFPEGTVIEVATQKANIGACRFYEKNGFEVKSISNIYHIWVDDYINQL